MKKKRIMASFPIRILAVSILGLLAGLFFNATRTMGLTSGALNLVVTARYVLSQLITFLAPVIILGLMASSIISVKRIPHRSRHRPFGSPIFPCSEQPPSRQSLAT